MIESVTIWEKEIKNGQWIHLIKLLTMVILVCKNQCQDIPSIKNSDSLKTVTIGAILWWLFFYFPRSQG
ncbi:hypothetical protein AU077_05860 [Streptococcus gallolyticus]|uniref:Uncharacterized protein n=1 Tax=Streptococcus macedonicus TaxID=59310 RepID=A0A2G3NWP9_STRMC|nr:hypothetical protein AU077_05860 [Streptococcus gallolyticus]PHV57916.1 hypothetical protein CS010_03405 [Streptococcus macedonicus]PHV59762.1 hypothetical protein CS005_07450 [Streptococcus macedonicus]